MMLAGKKAVASVVLLLSLLGAGLGLGRSESDARETPATNAKDPPAAKAAPIKKPAEAQAGVMLRGRALAPDGTPLAGATLLLLGKGDAPTELGTTAADGRFAVPMPKDRENAFLVVRADGLGIDFVALERLDPAKEIEFRAVRDRAIRGRVVDTQGKPVAGVRVTVKSVNVYADDSLDSFLGQWKKRHFMSGLPTGVRHLWGDPGSMIAVTTGADGRFTVAGTGVERLVCLRLRGAGIADAEVWVVNRDGLDPKPYNEATVNNTPKGFSRSGFNPVLYGPEPSVVAEAEKPIRGVVTEAATGKPRPGVEVLLTRAGDDLLALFLSAKTDAAGRYEIRGARKAKAYMVEVKADPAAGLLPRQVRATDTAGYQPITMDIPMVKGVVVTGRVLDTSTGKSMRGFAMTGVLSDNSHVKDYPEFNSSAWMPMQNTAADGSFRLVTIPGPVLFMGGPEPGRGPDGHLAYRYKQVVPDPKYPKYFPIKEGLTSAYYSYGGGLSVMQGNFCKVLEIKPDATVVEQDVLLEPANLMTVRIRDVNDQPVVGAWATGISTVDWHRPERCETDTCPAYNVLLDKPRLMFFYEPTRKIGGTLTLTGQEEKPVAMLGPMGSLTGRGVGADGKPRAGVVIDVYYRARAATEMHEHIHRARPLVTDATGAFRIDDLIPGREFQLYFSTRQAGKHTMMSRPYQVQPGKTLDTGDLKVQGDDNARD